jgi:hypothetical protein
LRFGITIQHGRNNQTKGAGKGCLQRKHMPEGKLYKASNCDIFGCCSRRADPFRNRRWRLHLLNGHHQSAPRGCVFAALA